MPRGPAVPVGGGVPVDPETGQRYGFLSRRAAERKLVIRAQLGLPWVLGALGAMAVIVVAAAVYLGARPDRPGPPYVDQGALSGYPAGAVTPLRDGSGWLDRRAGLRVVAAPAQFCPADGGWVLPGGVRADENGRGSTDSGVVRLPVRAANGRVYVDPSRPSQGTSGGAVLSPCPAPRDLH